MNDTTYEELLADEDTDFYKEHPNACRNCGDLYAVGGCPACGE